MRKWTTAEDAWLAELAEQYDAPVIGKIMGRTHNAIRRRASLLGIKLGAQQDWTATEVVQLEEYLNHGVSYRVIAKRLGRSESSIAGKVKRLREDAPQPAKHDPDESRLMALRMPFSQMAARINTGVTA